MFIETQSLEPVDAVVDAAGFAALDKIEPEKKVYKMKTYIKLLTGIAVVLFIALLLNLPAEKENTPVNMAPAGIINETGYADAKYENSIETVGSLEIMFSELIPHENAICENITWIKDVSISESEKTIAEMSSIKEAQIEADMIARKAEVLANVSSMGELGNYISLSDPRLYKIDRMEKYKKRWLSWEYFAASSAENNSRKAGIYFKENLICSNAEWRGDSNASDVGLMRELIIQNTRNIARQYNSSEITNGSNQTLFSRDGSRYVLGPSKNGEFGYGIYFKK